ncbi:MAG: potassium channel protein [Cyanobacteriota bacterium ELA615]
MLSRQKKISKRRGRPTPKNQKYHYLRQQLTFGMLCLVGLFVTGTLWYRLVEKWTWLDSAYMTMNVLATVGIGEIYPLSQISRLFTLFLILVGVIIIGYLVNRFTEALIQGYFQDRIKRRQENYLLESLNQHYILCGFGRTGYQIALEFYSEGVPFVLIEADPAQCEIGKDLGYVVVQGDATLDEVLIKARVATALCLVSALSSDANNLYTVLSAKTLNPKIRAIARASTEEAVKKLSRAGADAVVSPYITGGRRLAAAALRPQVMDFVDGILSSGDNSVYMEEFAIDPLSCPCLNKSLRETKLRSVSGALIVAIRRQDGELIVSPTADTIMLAYDVLISIGTAQQLRQLNQILAPLASNNN